jgi:prepilin-type N-terminal cleavage/methylation domain-containing protein
VKEMNKVNRKKQKNEKGFTMIELIIVVAIMGIIGAVLVPMFGNMSDKARLSTDITTVKTLQRQIDIYKAENGEYPDTFNDTTPDIAKVIADLKDVYIEAKDIDAAGLIKLQTKDAVIIVDTTHKRCNLEIPSALYTVLKVSENTDYKDWVKSKS